MKELTIQEDIFYPFRNENKSFEDSIVVVAPSLKGQTNSYTLFRFDIGNDPAENKTLSPVDKSTIVASKSQTEKIAADPNEPLWRRILALNWLAESYFSQVSDLILNYAGNDQPSAFLRNSASLNLGVHHYKPALGLLLSQLQSVDVGSREFAVTALGEMGDRSAAPSVRSCIGDTNETVASQAIQAVGQLMDSESVPVLLEVLRNATKSKLYFAATQSLKQIGTADAWSGLIQIVSGRKNDFQARRSSTIALGQARYAAAIPPFSKILADDTEIVGIRLNVINALNAIGGEEAFTAIKGACNAKDRTLAFSAIQTMVRSKEGAGETFVLGLAATSTYVHREEAVNQLGQARVISAAPAMKAILHEQNVPVKVRVAALSALSKIDAKQILPEDLTLVWSDFQTEKDKYTLDRIADELINANFAEQSAVSLLIAGLDPQKNKAWYANVKLLRKLTGQTFGPQSEYVDPKIRESELSRWHQWWEQK